MDAMDAMDPEYRKMAQFNENEKQELYRLTMLIYHSHLSTLQTSGQITTNDQMVLTIFWNHFQKTKDKQNWKKMNAYDETDDETILLLMAKPK